MDGQDSLIDLWRFVKDLKITYFDARGDDEAFSDVFVSTNASESCAKKQSQIICFNAQSSDPISSMLLKARALDFSATYPIIEEWVFKLLSGGVRELSSDSWMMLHTFVFKFATIVHPVYGRAIPDILYFALFASIEKFVAITSDSIMQTMPHALISLSEKWHAFETGMQSVNGIFDYLNRFWISSHCASSDDPISRVFPIFQMGVRVWNDKMVQKVQGIAFESCWVTLQALREGRLSEIDDVTNYMQMLEKINTTIGEREHMIFDQVFSAAFLENSFRYFCSASDSLFAKLSPPQYAAEIDGILAREKKFFNFLPTATLNLLHSGNQEALVNRQKEKILNYFEGSLAKYGERRREISQIFNLMIQTKSGEKDCAAILRTFAVSSISDFQRRVGDIEKKEIQVDRKKQLKKTAVSYVENLIYKFRQLVGVVYEIFGSSEVCLRAILEALSEIISHRENAADIFAHAFHVSLAAGTRRVFNAEKISLGPEFVDQKLMSEMCLLASCVSSKDVFERLGLNNLSRRILDGDDFDPEVEERCLAMLEREMGGDMRSKGQRMIKDFIVSKSLNESFVEFLTAPDENNSTLPPLSRQSPSENTTQTIRAELILVHPNSSSSPSHHRYPPALPPASPSRFFSTLSMEVAPRAPTETKTTQRQDPKISILILSQASWPLRVAPVSPRIPMQLETALQSFQDFYSRKFDGRRLRFHVPTTLVDVRPKYLARPYEWRVSAQQYLILDEYNRVESSSVGALAESLGISESEVELAVKGLEKHSVLLRGELSLSSPSALGSPRPAADASRSISLNLRYQSPAIKTKIAAPRLDESSIGDESRQSDSVQVDVSAERRVLLQAAIVRVMKASGALRPVSRSDIALRAAPLVAQVFRAEPADVDESLAILAEKEFVTEVGEDQFLYTS